LIDHKVSLQSHRVLLGVVVVVEFFVEHTHLTRPFVVHGAADCDYPCAIFLLFLGVTEVRVCVCAVDHAGLWFVGGLWGRLDEVDHLVTSRIGDETGIGYHFCLFGFEDESTVLGASGVEGKELVALEL
jgi:hypothetical protein